jgi:hypothetical protein
MRIEDLLARYGESALGRPAPGEGRARARLESRLRLTDVNALRRRGPFVVMLERPVPAALASSLAINAALALASPAAYVALASTLAR